MNNLVENVNSLSKGEESITEETQPLLKERIITDNELIKILDMVTIQKDVKPVGTYKYEVFEYPSDIDLFEKINLKLPRDQFIKNMGERICTIVRSIVLSENISFIEIKIGEDLRLDYNFNNFEKESLKLLDSIAQFLKNEWITDIEATKVTNLVSKYNENKNADVLEELISTVREFKMLRWTASEVIAKKKKLRGNENKYMSIYEGLNLPVLTKLDTLVWWNNRYIEMTNFFYFEITDDTGKVTIISKPFDDYMMSLKKDIYKYGGCGNYQRDSLKMLKRIFIKNALLYRSTHNYKLIEEMNSIIEIINKSPSVLSQIKADFEALESIIQHLSKINLQNICIMINNMSKRFNNKIIDANLTKDFNEIEDKLFIMYASYVSMKNSNEKDVIYNKFIEVLNENIKLWIPRLKSIVETNTKTILDGYPQFQNICIELQENTSPVLLGGRLNYYNLYISNKKLFLDILNI